jgi:hypothetical protein
MCLKLPPRSGLLRAGFGPHATAKPSNKLLAATDLDSDTWVGEVKRIRGKKLPLTAAGVQGLRAHSRTIEPARTLAAETLNLERTLSELVNQAYGLTPAEIDLMWKTAPPRMPIPPPGCPEPDKMLLHQEQADA